MVNIFKRTSPIFIILTLFLAACADGESTKTIAETSDPFVTQPTETVEITEEVIVIETETIAPPTEEIEPVIVCVALLSDQLSDEQIAEFNADNPHIDIQRAHNFYLEGTRMLLFEPPPGCPPPWP